MSCPPRVYASHASAEFNARLDAVLRRLTADTATELGRELVVLVLGGGYGRGEGGVVVRDGREQPFNDLDLTIVVRHRRRVPLARLDPICRRYAGELGIHVDFSRPLTPADVRRLPHWLMWQDLVNGHIELAGPPGWLRAHAPPRILEPLPAIEATRLLLNRGAGLLWAMRVVDGLEPEPDEGFVRRNWYKCALALGDALLIAHRRHATPYRGRDERLAARAREDPEVAGLDLLELYRRALGFKFRPDLAPAVPETREALAGLAALWAAVLLHVETVRTRRCWEDLDDYVQWPGLREPEEHTPGKVLRNLAHGLRRRRPSLRYPREELYTALPALLGQAGELPPDWDRASRDFLATWSRFN